MVTADLRSETGVGVVGRLDQLMGRATFICGHPKSGTSLVLTLLDSHPQLVVYPEESGYFRRFEPRVNGLDDQARLTMADELILQIFSWDVANPPPSQEGFPDRDYSDINYEQVKREFRELVGRAGGAERSVLPAAVLAYGAVSGMLGQQTVRWVEKTPYNEQFADRIFELWPAARCVHVVRDPRDNFASYRKKHPNWNERTFARSWQHSLAEGLRNVERFGAARYLLIRYEDLVAEPDLALDDLATFLGIQLDASLRRPTRAGKPWGGNSMFGERFEGISDSPIGRYQRELEPASIQRLEMILHPWMEQNGYPLEFPVRVSSRILGWLIRTSFPLASLRARLWGAPEVPGA